MNRIKVLSGLRWFLPILCALIGACVLLAACGQHAAASAGAASSTSGPAATGLLREGASVAVPQASPLRHAIQVAVAAQTAVARSIAVPGVIEADPARLVRIVPPVAGRIVRVYKSLGDAVKAGEPLLMVDSADLAQATSDASKAAAALLLARHNLDRQQDLVASGIAAMKDLQQAQSDQLQAQSEDRRARGRLGQLGTLPGQGDGHDFTMTAPISGHVIEMTGAQGGFWNDTNAPLMTVADLSKVWLSASVQEKDMASVFVGQTAQIVLDAYPGEPLAGRVAYVAQTLDADTRTVKVRVALDNSAERLRPGMFATAILSSPAHESITVPSAALIQDGFNTRVYVESVPWTFEARLVKTGPQIGSQIEIKSGLRPGERIVVKDGVLLND
jgi:cobalt-zinc-cadmium efflux system membrane fusion protein